MFRDCVDICAAADTSVEPTTHTPVTTFVSIPTNLRSHGAARYHHIGLASSVRAIDIFILPQCSEVEERCDGGGTIYFGDQPSYRYGAIGPGIATQQGGSVQFFRIPDVKKVYTIVHEAMQRQQK